MRKACLTSNTPMCSGSPSTSLPSPSSHRHNPRVRRSRLKQFVRNAVDATGWDHEPPPPSHEFHLTGLTGGRKVLYLSCAGYGFDVAGPFDLKEDELRSGIDLTLRPAATASRATAEP